MFEREPITAGELMDKQFLPKPVIVEGMLPAGTYILAGTPKIGKSFLMTQLCWSVAEGIPFLGLATRKSTVLYLALEDTQERLQSRLARMFGTDWAGSEFHLLFQINQQGDALIQRFQDFILEHPDTRLIIIDTLQKIREDGGEKCSYASDYEMMASLKSFADESGVCLLLVHHTRKQQADDRFDMISGTNGLLGAADGGFLLQKERRTDCSATLDISGRDQQDQRLYLTRNSERLIWELQRAETEFHHEAPDPVLEAVAEFITSERPVWCGTATELAAALEINMKPNALAMRLNVRAWQLNCTYHICYESARTHAGRSIRLTLDQTVCDDRDGRDDLPDTGSAV